VSSRAPSTALRAVPLPRCAGEDPAALRQARNLDGAPVFLTSTAYGLRYEEEGYSAIRLTDVNGYQAIDKVA
jgi:hypothetical protein